MVSMIELFQHAVQLAAHSLVLADAKDLGDLVGGQAEYAQLTGALEDFVDGEIPPEQEIAAVFDLIQRVLAAQGDGGAVLFGKFRPQDQRPVIQAFTDNLRAEAIGGCLERFHVGNPQKGVIVFAEANTLALEFPGDDGMTIEVVRSLEGEEGTDAYRKGTEHFVADVEVVMRIARPVPSENAVVRVVGRIFWRQGAEGGPSFHTLE